MLNKYTLGEEMLKDPRGGRERITIRGGFREDGRFDLGFEECRGVFCEAGERGRGAHHERVKRHGGLSKLYALRAPNASDRAPTMCYDSTLFSNPAGRYCYCPTDEGTEPQTGGQD